MQEFDTKTRYLILALFLIGLIIRIGAVWMPSSGDVDVDVKWGKATYELGLAKSFEGAYFPVQYLIYAGAYGLSLHLPVSAGHFVKIFNIIFPCDN